MLVRECMQRDVVTVSPQTSILNARRLLRSHGIRHLPVVDGDAVVGMVSDRDVRINDVDLNRGLASLQSDLVSGRYRRVQTIMSSPPLVVFPTDTVAFATKLMVSRGVSALPVIDAGALAGIVTLTDCALALCRENDRQAHPPERPREARVPMPAGDPRPGRPESRPAALVVTADSDERLRLRRELAAAGYEVTTCPGPAAGVTCPALQGGDRCERVPAGAKVVVIDAGQFDAPVIAAYRRWLPDAAIRQTGP